MSPHKPQIFRFSPFVLPLLVVLVLAAWMLVRDSSTTEVGVAPATASTQELTHTAQRTSKASAHIQERLATLADLTRKMREETPPSSALVADLLDRFKHSDKRFPQEAVRQIVQLPVGKKVAVHAAGIDWSGTVDSQLDGGGVVHTGVTLDDELGRFQLSLREDDRIQASVFFNGESHALAFHGFPENGAWKMEDSSVELLLCVPAGSVYPLSQNDSHLLAPRAPVVGNPPARGPLSAPPALSSDPDSRFVLYIDLDGEEVTHPLWADGQTINAQPHARAEEVEFVTRVWERVVEDFAGFDINVTTDREVFDAAAISTRVMCVVTPTDDAAPFAGGVAYLNSFGQDIPCWAFNDTEDTLAETISHEIGHTLGLIHDGLVTGVEYYGGHGTGPYSWAPIMGAFFANPNFEEVTTWSRGEYPQANNQEDDLRIITTQNGFGYRRDDKGNSLDFATPLEFINGRAVDKGVIERNTDEDWFSFPSSGGPMSLRVNVTDINSPEASQRGSNLAVSAELYDSQGELITSSNPTNTLDASVSATIPAGTFFLRVQGEGRGTLATGFSDYASLGQYQISGTVVQEDLIVLSPPSKDFPSSGGTTSFRISTKLPWTWEASEPWVTSVEPIDQSGTQIFEYRVDRNLELAPRNATIRIRSGGYSVTHTINQEPAGLDDHGNTPEFATLIAQISETDGILETDPDVDVFQINVKGFGNLTLYTTGVTDTFGQLLDVTGKVIASNDNGRHPNFRIARPVSTGTYFLRVRHALPDGGVGAYSVISRFSKSPALLIDPAHRTVGPAGGGFQFNVTSNAAWNWSTGASWIKSSVPSDDSLGKTFSYQVSPNRGLKPRKATITFKSGNSTVVHRVVQNGALVDDHGDTRATATVLPRNGALSGQIESEGDVDMFRIVLDTSGTLVVRTSGSLDSHGSLSDAVGNEIASNDDFSGKNFQITRSVAAGTYFVAVRHFGNDGLGAYKLASSFTPSALVKMVYEESEGGAVRGPKRQTVPLGGSGRSVVAVPKRGYSFSQWSDGKTSPVRLDENLKSHVAVVAQFVPTFSARVMGGPNLQDNQLPPVDFGTIGTTGSKTMTFVVKNSGSTPLRNLRFTKSGLNPASWEVRKLARTTLQPGQSVNLVATLSAPTIGSKSATITLLATGAQAPFRIRVMGSVSAAANQSANLAGNTSKASASSRIAASGAANGQPSATAESWVRVNDEGLIRHTYRRPRGDKELPVFWISGNGKSWSKASLLKVVRLRRGADWDVYLAVFPPPNPLVRSVLISETHPKRPKP